MTGLVGYHAGLNAELSVARDYADRGFRIAVERYRAKSGEIDLIAERNGELVFVEVKKSKSHSRAAERLSERQIKRIYATASEYLATQPNGQNTNARFDVALVDGAGRIEILENAFAA